ncbi:MAG: aminotransferase class V-fold PLP-dependent enzyme [Symploca sp. SIO3C6]|nr:aminotransferase class V-fold PLP-dependent enzyme [Symploca sp. SIO3C6]
MSGNYTSLRLFEELRDAGVISKDVFNDLCDKLGRLLKKIDSTEINWSDIRDEWDFAHVPETERVIPMNAANLCPAPTEVVEAINTFRTEYNKNVSQQERTVAGALAIQDARYAIAEELGLVEPLGDGEPVPDVVDLAIVRNASEANNALNAGYSPWNPDGLDNIVIWNENHPTNYDAWWLRGGRTANEEGGLFEIRVVTLPENASSEEIETAFASQMNERTKFLTFTETSNVSGIRIPRSVISNLFKKANELSCHLHVDGAQTWGAQKVQLSLDEAADENTFLKCHSFSASSHKWFCGPKETGILYMDPSKAANFTPSIFAYDYKITIPKWNELPNSARRFELLGQRDDVNIVAMLVEQDFLTEIGQEVIEERIKYLATNLKTELQENDWDLTTPLDENLSHGVVISKVPDKPGQPSLYDYLYDQHRIATSSSGGIRICPHIYNLEEDIDKVVSAMNTWRNLP